MKKIKNFTILLVLVSVFISQNTFAKDASTILLSETSGKYSLDFLNEDRVTALQFDIILDGENSKVLEKTSLDSCLVGLPKSHTGMCTVKGNKMRVIVYSTTNEVLKSGNIGFFNLNNVDKSNIKINSIVMGTPEIKEIKGEALLDLGVSRVELDRYMNK